MANAATIEIVEHTLNVAIEQWESLPEIEAEFYEWSRAERVDFAEEWPLENQRLRDLERYASNGLMTEGQLRKHKRLQETVKRNHPVAARILNG